jgi:hypothetical protein
MDGGRDKIRDIDTQWSIFSHKEQNVYQKTNM